MRRRTRDTAKATDSRQQRWRRLSIGRSLLQQWRTDDAKAAWGGAAVDRSARNNTSDSDGGGEERGAESDGSEERE
ncbi:hypothetical protein Syun_017669 [Stephania yunnanensis]|uniref:Uncharacterized protein n=1 Tax=Stephania yunnanensis TaxID=152371 RepID=A0AAP0P2L7_9MAGN